MQTKASILIACGNTTLAKHFTGILAEDFVLDVLSNAAHTCTAIAGSHPHLVILDPNLFKYSLAETVTKITKKTPHTRIIVLEGTTHTPVNRIILFKAGVHGFCAYDLKPDLLVKAAHAVCNGEIWVPRQLIAQLIGELARENSKVTVNPGSPGAKSVERLTPRELQVAQMVHLGGNNKMIARELDISERTVKAHLSAIFRKLKIENRLHLALYFSNIG
jgi:two-component system, NarL family, nitrate/nitrite response regulator NarL